MVCLSGCNVARAADSPNLKDVYELLTVLKNKKSTQQHFPGGKINPALLPPLTESDLAFVRRNRKLADVYFPNNPQEQVTRMGSVEKAS